MKRYLYLNALEIVESDALDASVGSEDYKPKLNDSSIYVSLAKLTDLEQIKNYYEENKDKVNDPENLRQKAREQYKAISDAKKMFEGVENG
jgi:DNA polymerase IIIc chi subunit